MRHIKKLATRIGNKGTQVTTTETLKKGSPKITIQKTVVVTERIESPTPVINILTRTSNRPNGFKRCSESIERQTYKNIRHIVSIDNLDDEEYVKSHNVEYFFMDKEVISKENDIPDPQTGTRFIYNLYLNHLINEVKEGWVFILDDDDYFSDVNSVQKMVNAIKNPTDLILWQMKYPNGQVLPSLQELGMPPRLARISSQCFIVHSGIAKTIRWDGWKCGDFRFVQKAYAKTGEKRVIKEILVNLGGVGLGMKKDINTIQSNLMGNNVYNNNEHGSAIDIFKKKFNKPNVIINKNISTSDILFSDKDGISILITAFKTENYIEECLNSIENQQYFINNNNYEVIVAVDACINTYNKLLKIKNNYRNLTIVLLAENKGAYVAMNTIIPLSKYDNLIRFDSDDIMKENMVSKIMSVSNKADIIRFKFTSFNDKITNINKKESGRFPAVGVLFYKKKIFDLVGGYVSSRFSSDSELLIRTKKFVKTFELEDQLFYYRKHSNSLSVTVNTNERKKFNDAVNKTIYTKENLKITPSTNKIAKINKSRLFSQDLKIFIEKIINNNPFSIVRYGDGEMMILENKKIDLSNKYNGEHKFEPNNQLYSKLKNELLDSFTYKNDNYFVGVPCPCCIQKEQVNNMIKLSGQNENNLTWANIFVNNNYKYFKKYFLDTISTKEIVLICHKKADTKEFNLKYNVIKEFRVGANAWLNDYDKIQEIIEYSKNVNPNTVFLFMSGTFTKITIYKIHKLRQDLFLIDIGSALDLNLNLGETRKYLNKDSKNIDKICKWIF